jgi:nicotinamidase/pyrazinamidase
LTAIGNSGIIWVQEVTGMADVVLVVDMQRGFLEEGYPLFCGEAARAVIPRVQELLDRELARGSTIIFTADAHAPDDKEFQMWPPHCVKGTREAEIIPELASYVGQRIDSARYSAFFGTDLAQRLEELQPDMIHVCGVCTDICVLHTVADARCRDYDVVVYTDCVATFDEQMHQFGLKHIGDILGARLDAIGEEIPS